MIKKYKDLIEGIIHGYNFDILQELQTVTQFKRQIPKSFIETHYYYEELCIGTTKREAHQARQELIEGIVDTILHQSTTKHGDKMLPDNYARLFHALAILKLDKDSSLLLYPSDGDSVYSLVYNLWQLDNGSNSDGNAIITICWHLAEAMKLGYVIQPIHEIS